MPDISVSHEILDEPVKNQDKWRVTLRKDAASFEEKTRIKLKSWKIQEQENWTLKHKHCLLLLWPATQP